MLLRHSLRHEEAAAAIEAAVEQVLGDGLRTADIAGTTDDCCRNGCDGKCDCRVIRNSQNAAATHEITKWLTQSANAEEDEIGPVFLSLLPYRS